MARGALGVPLAQVMLPQHRGALGTLQTQSVGYDTLQRQSTGYDTLQRHWL